VLAAALGIAWPPGALTGDSAAQRTASAQATSVLHVKAVLTDTEGRPMPVPRHALLVSDNPATAPPRRIVTGLDGTVDVRLPPGNYTVESDRPFAFDGKAYQWTQIIDIVAGRDATLELTAGNATIESVAPADAVPGVAPPGNDPSLLLPRWQDSVVAIWTATSRATGFIVDMRGLVVTTRRAIDDPMSVAVQLTPALKVAARVLAADRERDTAVLWIDPKAIDTVRPVPLECAPSAARAVADGQELFAIGAPLRGPKSLASAVVGRVEPHAIEADFRIRPSAAGGPVFAASGTVVGMTSVVDEADEKRSGGSRVVPAAVVCELLTSAEEKRRAATPPSGAHLPVEPQKLFPVAALDDLAARRVGNLAPSQMSSSAFDVTFITPVQIHGARRRWEQASDGARGSDVRGPDAIQDRARLLTDFGDWSEYFADSPPVLLVRVTPKFVEGFWTKVGRGAASTQGVVLPPIKRLKPGFARLRAFCGTAEVTPIHPFAIEQRVSESDAIREGLYVFDPGALGPHCGTVKLVLYSEKDPEKGDTLTVDPAIVQKIWQDLTKMGSG
jgi:S1-C subfamily serine protease